MKELSKKILFEICKNFDRDFPKEQERLIKEYGRDLTEILVNVYFIRQSLGYGKFGRNGQNIIVFAKIYFAVLGAVM